MSSVIILNQSNVSETQNNVYQYNFPSGSVNFKDSQIGISSIILPYSWYNITSGYNNQTFSIVFPITDGSSTSTLNITIPEGFYELSSINSYIQAEMIANDIGYLTNGSGSNVYYIEFVANTNLNTAQLNCYVVPTSVPVGWSNPGSWSLPSTGSRVPQLVTDANNFSDVIGFARSTTFPSSSTQTDTYSISSSYEPQISPVSSVLVSTNLVNNVLSSPNNIITTIPITTTFGSQILYNPNEIIWLKILDGNFNRLVVSFLDQSFNNLAINDTNVTICLLIK